VGGVRRSSRVAFAIAWAVFLAFVVLVWRRIAAVPEGRGDVTGLVVMAACGAAGLMLLMAWLQDRERDRDRDRDS
jgi:hypothetical protein